MSVHDVSRVATLQGSEHRQLGPLMRALKGECDRRGVDPDFKGVTIHANLYKDGFEIEARGGSATVALMLRQFVTGWKSAVAKVREWA